MTKKSHKKTSIPIKSKDEDAITSEEKDSEENQSNVSKEVETPVEINDTDETESREELIMKLAAFKQETEQEHERLLRLSAEFENYKKRMTRQMDEFRKYANEALLKDLLSVVDNLERAVQMSGDEGETSHNACIIEGVEMTLNEILKILNKFQVTPIEALGKPFDPAFHEAVMQNESDKHPDNTIISELQKGYLLHGRLLRPAMVEISKGKS
ncbi:MAG: nucleotide exchange factor GrpE [Dissulfuribacterales bacterium]